MSELVSPDDQLGLADVETQPLPYGRAEPEEEKIEVVEAVVAGHICLDVIPTLLSGPVVFAPGRVIEAGRAILATGGPVSNTGLALHKLGITTRLMGKVGDDLFGQAILSILESHGPGLASGMVVAPGEASSYSIIISPPGVDRTFIHAPGCNDTFGADDVRYELLKIVRLFHFGYPPLMAHMYRDDGAELVSIFRQAKAFGVTTSLDLSLPDPSRPAGRVDWRTILSDTLPFVDIFLPSIEEILFMLRRPLFDQFTAKAEEANMVDYAPPDLVSELGQTLLDMGAKIVGLKVGHRGLYLRTSNMTALAQMGRGQPAKLSKWAYRELWAPCFATPVVGTTGSGDATISGFLMGLLRGMSPEATLSAACAVGACNVEAADAISGIRSWPETMERIAAGWPRLLLDRKGIPSLDMRAAGWQWDEIHELWVGPGTIL
jgi:sugar/nucleoside kinase (ribokinase family)